MSRTYRWWNKHKNLARLPESRLWWWKEWSTVNPFYFRHDRAILRAKMHRALRRLNKIKLQKGRDVEPLVKTNGWMTH